MKFVCAHCWQHDIVDVEHRTDRNPDRYSTSPPSVTDASATTSRSRTSAAQPSLLETPRAHHTSHRSILVQSNDLEAAIYIELLLAGFSRPFWIRINDDPAIGPVRDAIEPLLPDAWTDLNESHFPASLALSQSLVVEPDEHMDSAAKAGRLDLIRLLDAFRVPKFCMATMDEAAGAGHLSVVMFLHSKRTEGCTSMAMTMAAEGGHMDVIQFLHTNRTEGCHDSAITRAASGGHFEVISFLKTEYQLEPKIMPSDVPTRHIRHLHEKFQFSISESTVLNVLSKGTPDELRYCLSQLGQLKVLMEFFGDDDRFWTPSNLDNMAKYASVDMFEFLYEKRTERCTRAGLINAAVRGNPDVFKFLVRNYIAAVGKLDEGNLLSAAEGGNVEILKWLRDFDYLLPYWTSKLTEAACAKGRKAAVRYLSGELGIPMKRVSFFSDIVVKGQLNPVLFALDEFGYGHLEPFPPLMLRGIFREVCKLGTLEQIKHFSAQTPECPEALHHSTTAGRLDALRFLLEHRSERPDLYCMRCALDKPIEFVQFFIEEAGMDPTLLLPYAAESERLDIVRYLYNHLPPDTPLDCAIDNALTGNHFEVSKFLHLKRPATGQLDAAINQNTTMDMATFMAEHYAGQLGPSALVGARDSPFLISFDIFKFLVERGYLASVPPLSTEQLANCGPDFLEYVLAQGVHHHPTPDLMKVVILGGNISCLRVLARANPDGVATLPSVFLHWSLRTLPFLSTVAPINVTPAVMTSIIQRRERPVADVGFLLDRYPDCVRPEHLAVAAKTDTATALLLWRRAWKGGCPAAAMVEACKRGDVWLLKKFLKRLDEKDPEWKTALNECLAAARRVTGNDLELVNTIEEARTALFVGGFDFGVGKVDGGEG
ncbi:hypothetical protein HDU96_010389 [Phlyctochytrium bullatum]|nr:hypothetical protein HDU96_010389 [Phlyctochytrium bullatum]